MLVDYHVHPDYSLDAKDSIDAFCKRALEIGLDEICFTTHYDLDPVRKEKEGFVRVKGELVSFDSNWLDHYLADLKRARAIYEKFGLNIKYGIEVDYSKEVEDEIKRSLHGYSFDLILGAIHNLDHNAIHLEEEFPTYFEGKSSRELCEKYFQEVQNAVRSEIFDVIAHIDLYKKFGLEYYGENLLKDCVDLAEKTFDLMIEKNVGLEINTSCYRYGFDEAFPSEDLLRRWKERNPKILTIGSDAHNIQYLAKYVPKWINIAKKMGLKFCTFKERKVEQYF